MASINLLLMSFSFALVIYSASYRAKRQPIKDRAILHILFTGAGCVLASLGCLASAVALWEITLPDATRQAALEVGTALGALGMLGVAVPIFYYLPHIAAQPTRNDLVALHHQNLVLISENKRLRAEREISRRHLVARTFDAIAAHPELSGPSAPPPYLLSRELDAS